MPRCRHARIELVGSRESTSAPAASGPYSRFAKTEIQNPSLPRGPSVVSAVLPVCPLNCSLDPGLQVEVGAEGVHEPDAVQDGIAGEILAEDHRDLVEAGGGP